MSEEAIWAAQRERDAVLAEVARLRAALDMYEREVQGYKKRAEQAEAERDEARATKDMHKERTEQAEARLAKVVEIIEREAPIERRERIFERHPHLKLILAAAQLPANL